MGLDDVLRNAVAVAKRTTVDLRPEVLHRRWKGGNQPPFSFSDVKLYPIVEYTTRLVRSEDGAEAVSRAKLTFLEPLKAQGADGRREPIDHRDEFILPDGSSAHFLANAGFVDPTIGTPFAHEVYVQ